jgi:hypothetical protein
VRESEEKFEAASAVYRALHRRVSRIGPRIANARLPGRGLLAGARFFNDRSFSRGHAGREAAAFFNALRVGRSRFSPLCGKGNEYVRSLPEQAVM